jgi:outer membrane protein assembly factor BamB/TolA-binding protein
MSAISFLRLLEERSVLDPNIAAELRRQIEASKTPIRTDDVANLLVTKGYLTAHQRERFIAEYRKAQQGELKPKKPAAPVLNETVQYDGGSNLLQEAADFQLTPPPAGKRAKKTKPAAAAPESPLDPFAVPIDPLAITPDSRKPQGKGFVKRKSQRRWDSPLILFGTGGLVVLTILMVLFIILGLRGSASQVFNKAEEEYKSKSYTTAITTYNEYIRGYPSDPKISTAKVRRALAKVRQAAETQKNAEKALAVAREELPGITNEADFKAEGQGELASLLPSIALGLVARGKSAAKTEDAEKYLTLMKDSLKLVEDPVYITSKDRKGQEDRITEVRSGIAEVTRRIRRDEELTKGLESIRALLLKSETVAAYETRKKLIKDFPDLEGNKQLADAVLSISKKQRELVQVSKLEEPPSTEPWPVAEATSLALNSPRGGAAPGVESQIYVVLAEGVLYGLDAGSGKVIWRRFVGLDANLPAVQTAPGKASDVLLVDPGRGELTRVRGADGTPAWRLNLGSDLALPVIEGKRGLAAKRSGVVVEFDVETGLPSRQVRLPQTAAAGPGYSTDKKSLLQAGAHSNLYSISAADLSCRDVYYLAHREGSIAVAPTFVSGLAVVAENAGPDFAMLHFFSLGEKGEIQKAQESVRVRGRVFSPPIVAQRRIFVMSNAGELLIFEIDNTKKENPAVQIAKLDSTSNDLVYPFALVQDATVWLADRRFQMLEIQSSRGLLARRWAVDEGDIYLAPLARFGDVAVTIRRRAGSPAITASAKRLADGDTIWQNSISAPISIATPSADGSVLNVVDGQANYYRLDQAAFAQPIATGAVSNPDSNLRALSFVQAIPSTNNRTALFDPLHVRDMLYFDNAAQSLELAEGSAPVSRTAITPEAFLDGFLAPTSAGQIAFLPPPKSSRAILPFQPELEPGAKIEWVKPSAGQEEFVAATTGGRFYRIGVQANPQPHFQLLASADLNTPLSGAIITLGDKVVAASPSAAGDSLLPLALTDLSAGEPIQLGGRITRPLERVGDVGFVSNPVDGLVCIEAGPKVRWKTPLAYGELAGPPLAAGNDWLLTSQNGVVWRVAGDTGKEVARFELNQPLSSSVVVWGERYVLPGRDSVIHLIDKNKLEPSVE